MTNITSALEQIRFANNYQRFRGKKLKSRNNFRCSPSYSPDSGDFWINCEKALNRQYGIYSQKHFK